MSRITKSVNSFLHKNFDNKQNIKCSTSSEKAFPTSGLPQFFKMCKAKSDIFLVNNEQF